MSAQGPGSAPEKPKGWRGRKSPAASGGASAAAKGAGWAQRPDRSAESATRWHRVKVGGWLLLALTLIGGFLFYLMYRPMRTPLLMAAATQYALPWPPNAWAKEDLQGLTVLDRQEVATCVQLPWESNDEGLRRLRDQLDAVRPGGPGKDVVIVYLSIHGAVDATGQPCLIPPGAAIDGSGWLPVRELLQTLFVEARPGRVPDHVRKLLVLDAGRIHSNWGAGILYNAFAERLSEVVADLKVPNLAVLNSASPGQAARASPELGGSVFGHFFSQGLQGAADVEQGDHNGRVSLQELQRYVAAHVRQWTLENRADVQIPMLIPADPDMALVHAGPSARTASSTPSSTPDPRWADVARFWLRHQELARSHPYRLSPLAWETFQHQLLRLEQLTLAGAAYDDEFRQTKTDLVVLADQLAAQAAPRRLPAFSLPLAAQFGWWAKEDAERLESKRRGTKRTHRQPAASPAVESKLGCGACDQRCRGGRCQTKGLGRALRRPLARSLRRSRQPLRRPTRPRLQRPNRRTRRRPAKLRQNPPRPLLNTITIPLPRRRGTGASITRRVNTSIACWRSCRSTKGRPAADVAEIQFLRILAGQLDWQAAAERVPDALSVRRWASNAGAPAEPQVQYLIWPLVDRADAARRRGDDGLLVGTPAALAEADAHWTEAVGSEEEMTGYRWAVRSGGTSRRRSRLARPRVGRDPRPGSMGAQRFAAEQERGPGATCARWCSARTR